MSQNEAPQQLRRSEVPPAEGSVSARAKRQEREPLVDRLRREYERKQEELKDLETTIEDMYGASPFEIDSGLKRVKKDSLLSVWMHEWEMLKQETDRLARDVEPPSGLHNKMRVVEARAKARVIKGRDAMTSKESDKHHAQIRADREAAENYRPVTHDFDPKAVNRADQEYRKAKHSGANPEELARLQEARHETRFFDDGKTLEAYAQDLKNLQGERAKIESAIKAQYGFSAEDLDENPNLINRGKSVLSRFAGWMRSKAGASSDQGLNAVLDRWRFLSKSIEAKEFELRSLKDRLQEMGASGLKAVTKGVESVGNAVSERIQSARETRRLRQDLRELQQEEDGDSVPQHSSLKMAGRAISDVTTRPIGRAVRGVSEGVTAVRASNAVNRELNKLRAEEEARENVSRPPEEVAKRKYGVDLGNPKAVSKKIQALMEKDIPRAMELQDLQDAYDKTHWQPEPAGEPRASGKNQVILPSTRRSDVYAGGSATNVDGAFARRGAVRFTGRPRFEAKPSTVSEQYAPLLKFEDEVLEIGSEAIRDPSEIDHEFLVEFDARITKAIQEHERLGFTPGFDATSEYRESMGNIKNILQMRSRLSSKEAYVPSEDIEDSLVYRSYLEMVARAISDVTTRPIGRAVRAVGEGVTAVRASNVVNKELGELAEETGAEALAKPRVQEEQKKDLGEVAIERLRPLYEKIMKTKQEVELALTEALIEAELNPENTQTLIETLRSYTEQLQTSKAKFETTVAYRFLEHTLNELQESLASVKQERSQAPVDASGPLTPEVSQSSARMETVSEEEASVISGFIYQKLVAISSGSNSTNVLRSLRKILDLPRNAKMKHLVSAYVTAIANYRKKATPEQRRVIQRVNGLMHIPKDQYLSSSDVPHEEALGAVKKK